MLKITFPNGIVVEGDVAEEVTAVISGTLGLPVEQFKVVNAGILPQKEFKNVKEDFEEDPVQLDLIKLPKPEFRHRYSNHSKRSILVGQREDEVLQIAKTICEVHENRNHLIKTRDIWDLSDKKVSVQAVGSALQNLKHKGVVRHCSTNRKRWIITTLGWNATYRLVNTWRFVGGTA